MHLLPRSPGLRNLYLRMVALRTHVNPFPGASVETNSHADAYMLKKTSAREISS